MPAPPRRSGRRFLLPGFRAWALFAALCACRPAPEPPPLRIPHGYIARLEVKHQGQRYGFGPFVGYYFKPTKPSDLSQLDFVCFNERNFYASDVPANTLLYGGEAVFAVLPQTGFALPNEPERIRPVFFEEAPAPWIQHRPAPQDEFLHFHSCYDARGPAQVGYWIRHQARATFTYDMGGRVGPTSPLYHRVEPGPDRAFARIIEFDEGPSRSP